MSLTAQPCRRRPRGRGRRRPRGRGRPSASPIAGPDARAGPRGDGMTMMSGRRQPQLELPAGYRLRPWSTSDAPDMVLGMRDALVRQYAGQLIDDRSGALAALHTWSDQWQEGLGAAWAICDPGRQIVGSVRFGMIDPDL